MTRAVNDATLQKAGDIYQYLIALRDCFELNDGDTLQIETNGDVSIINDVGGRFQREVKHHFGNTSISDRDIDFWKKLCIIKQENTQDNKQDEMLRGEKLWQIILHRLRLQTQCWIALHLYRRKSEK